MKNKIIIAGLVAVAFVAPAVYGQSEAKPAVAMCGPVTTTLYSVPAVSADFFVNQGCTEFDFTLGSDRNVVLQGSNTPSATTPVCGPVTTSLSRVPAFAEVYAYKPPGPNCVNFHFNIFGSFQSTLFGY